MNHRLPRPSSVLALLLPPIAATANLLGQAHCTSSSQVQIVSPSLATLRVQTSAHRIRRGTPLNVTLTLRAGPRGVYVTNFFGGFMQTCEHGFSVALLTQAGVNADHRPRGCAASLLHSYNDTAQDQLKNYIRLSPAETRTWRVVVHTSQVEAGLLCLHAEYLSLGYMIDEVSRLPEVDGTMANGRILAQPVAIQVRR